MEAVFAQSLPLALLQQDASQLRVYAFFERHVSKSRWGIRDRNQPRKLPAGLGNGCGPGTGACPRPPSSFSLIYDIPQLLGEAHVAAASGVRRDLERNAVKAGIVPFGVAPDKRLDLFGIRHRYFVRPTRTPGMDPTDAGERVSTTF